MKENEQELFPLMPQAVKDSLACSLLRAVQRWKGASEEQIRDAEERERQAQAILAARELNAKYGEEKKKKKERGTASRRTQIPMLRSPQSPAILVYHKLRRLSIPCGASARNPGPRPPPSSPSCRGGIRSTTRPCNPSASARSYTAYSSPRTA